MIEIRPYTALDYDTVASWWKWHDGHVMPEGYMPEGSSFVALHDGEPVGAVTVLLTNSKEQALGEGLVTKPHLKDSVRHRTSELLVDAIFKHAKAQGYKRILAIGPNLNLTKRYMELGFRVTLSHVSIMVKDL